MKEKIHFFHIFFVLFFGRIDKFASFGYNELLNVPLKDQASLTNTSEIIVRSLRQPSVIDVNIDNGNILLNIEKELGVEIVGDTKIKVPIEDIDDDYEEIVYEQEF